MGARVDDQNITRVKLYGGLIMAVLSAGFTAAVFLFTHYASASDLQRLSSKVDDVADTTQQHSARIDDMREDLKYIRAAVDDLRSRR